MPFSRYGKVFRPPCIFPRGDQCWDPFSLLQATAGIIITTNQLVTNLVRVHYRVN